MIQYEKYYVNDSSCVWRTEADKMEALIPVADDFIDRYRNCRCEIKQVAI